MKVGILVMLIMSALANSLQCKQGEVITSEGHYIHPRYIEGCSTYLDNFSCKACNYRYELMQNGLCQLSKNPKQECCRVWKSKGVCKTCQTGLILIKGVCQEFNIIGCLQKNEKGECTNCALDFYLLNGRCQMAIKHCLSYADEKKAVCKQCNIDYSLISNSCVKNTILGCKTEAGQKCLQCFQPFSLNNGTCQIKNCKNYDDYRCVACQCGYYLTSQGHCSTMEAGCIRYSRGNCVDCLPKYRLKGNKCQIEGCLQSNNLQCIKCEDKYELAHGGCLMKNCISWKDGQCQICETGFHYRKGDCVSEVAMKTQ